MSLSMKHKFEHLVVGGTFDLLHKGHKQLIELAVERSKRVTIGLTSEEMAKGQLNKNLDSSYKKRLAELENYLGPENRTNVNIVKIDDIYGVAITDKTIDGIVVTKETMKGANIVNSKRRKLGLEKLQIIVAPTVLAKDKKRISSNRIRLGQINREGLVYWQYINDRNLSLPDNLRPILAKPFGRVVKNELILRKDILGSLHIVSVGDEVTRTLNRLGVDVNLTIVDFKINRKKQIGNLNDLGIHKNGRVVNVDNPAGTINSKLTDAIKAFFDDNTKEKIIIVEGEEDLAVIPVILLAPLGTHVVYGQREKGAVIITVDEQIKVKVLKLVKKFKTF